MISFSRLIKQKWYRSIQYYYSNVPPGDDLMNLAKTTNQLFIQKFRLHESCRNNFGYGGDFIWCQKTMALKSEKFWHHEIQSFITKATLKIAFQSKPLDQKQWLQKILKDCNYFFMKTSKYSKILKIVRFSKISLKLSRSGGWNSSALVNNVT